MPFARPEAAGVCRLTTKAVARCAKLCHALFLEGSNDIVDVRTGDTRTVFAEPRGDIKARSLSTKGEGWVNHL